MMSCWPSIRPAFLLVPMLALASVVPAQDWECIQVLNDGSVDLGWAPDTQGAAAYSVVPLLPPPDYTPLLLQIARRFPERAHALTEL